VVADFSVGAWLSNLFRQFDVGSDPEPLRLTHRSAYHLTGNPNYVLEQRRVSEVLLTLRWSSTIDVGGESARAPAPARPGSRGEPMICLDENRSSSSSRDCSRPRRAARSRCTSVPVRLCRRLMAEVAKLSFTSSSRSVPGDADPGAASLRTPTSSAALEPEQVLAGRFRIIRRLGRGSFGNVYEAQDLQLEERVALKLLRPEVRDNPGLLGHLTNEDSSFVGKSEPTPMSGRIL